MIKHLGHKDYKDLSNIVYMEVPKRFVGDSDDDGTDEDFEWPSRVFDEGRALADELVEEEVLHHRTLEWVQSTDHPV